VSLFGITECDGNVPNGFNRTDTIPVSHDPQTPLRIALVGGGLAITLICVVAGMSLGPVRSHRRANDSERDPQWDGERWWFKDPSGILLWRDAEDDHWRVWEDGDPSPPSHVIGSGP
jgi:hypothetical protein